MAYYDALKTLWATLPAGDTTAQKLAAVNAMAAAGPNADVAPSAVKGKLLLMSAYFPLKAFAAGSTNGNATHDNALGAAMSLIEMIDTPNAPLFGTSDATVYAHVKGMADAVLAQETAAPGSTGFTQSVHDALLALAATTVPWWQASGYRAPICEGDLVVSGLDTSSGYTFTSDAPQTSNFNVTLSVTVNGPHGSLTSTAVGNTIDANYAQFYAARCVQNMIDRDASLATFG